MKILTGQLRRFFPGVSWRNPFVRVLLRLLDPFDYIVRQKRALSHLPPYSVRVRSNGVGRQFGGLRFTREGQYLVRILRTHAVVSSSSRLLEIGCGCGRTAIQLTNLLSSGEYRGMDIDSVSVAACKENAIFNRRPFHFDLMDIYNGVYNPEGRTRANSYEFPYSDRAFDVIYMFSVFTHMLPEEIENYVQEYSRLLRINGLVLLSVFLMDHGIVGNDISFPYRQGNSYLLSPDIPEKAVGYELNFFDHIFLSKGFHRQDPPLYGQWRKTKEVETDTEFAQDILVYKLSH